MPELPEVEHARQCLTRWVQGAVVASVAAPRSHVQGATAASFAKALTGAQITRVDRKGKQLRVATDRGVFLFSHLGMTGKWVKRPADAPPERFEKARLVVKRGRERHAILYVDPRMLGRLLATHEDTKAWRALGPDPLSDGVDLTKVLRSTKSIKEALMDQVRLAGVGNIQAAEALWRARVDPRTKASSLTAAQGKALGKAVMESIRFTLRKQGEDQDEIAYVEERGAPNPFRVYGRQGEPCPRCRTTLVRIVQGGRSTVLCPSCQGKPSRSLLQGRGTSKKA